MTIPQRITDEARRTAEVVVSRYAGQAEPIDKLVDHIVFALLAAEQRGREMERKRIMEAALDLVDVISFEKDKG